LLARIAIIVAICMPLLAPGPAIAEAASQPEGEVCDETHCCVEFETPNGGLVECYLREEKAPEPQHDQAAGA